MERIDKVVATAFNLSRREAGLLIKKGRITVNGSTVRNIGAKVDEINEEIARDGEKAVFRRFVYIMMNKPKGVVSASRSPAQRTVVDLLPDDMKRKGLFPAGRLDKDTTGFVLITDDGALAHDILSPKNHIPKTYIAKLDKPFDDKTETEFLNGVELDGVKCLPAQISAVGGDRAVAEVTITQGMYHQIKRMFLKFGITVKDLKRIKMGSLELDDSLKEGECRYLSRQELELLKDRLGL